MCTLCKGGAGTPREWLVVLNFVHEEGRETFLESGRA